MRLHLIGLSVTLALCLLVVPLTAPAQPPRQVPRIAWLSLASREAIADDYFELFRQGLRELGYVERRGISKTIVPQSCGTCTRGVIEATGHSPAPAPGGWPRTLPAAHRPQAGTPEPALRGQCAADPAMPCSKSL